MGHHKWVWPTSQPIPATTPPPYQVLQRVTVAPLPSNWQANSITLPDDVLHLQEETNNAMVHLLTLKASVHVCQQKVISATEIALHQNESKTSEAIKEIKACYVAALSDAEATYAAAIRDTESAHSASSR